MKNDDETTPADDDDFVEIDFSSIDNMTDTDYLSMDWKTPEILADENERQVAWEEEMTQERLQSYLTEPTGPFHTPFPGKTLTSWDSVDVRATLEAGLDEEPPDYCQRTDGIPLLYRGKVSSISGEPESCKGWFACYAARTVLAKQQHVVYVDFEDSAKGILSRMVALGCSWEILIQFFHVINPDGPFDADARQRLAWEFRPAHPRFGSETIGLVVLDGVTQALANEGKESDNGDHVATFFRLLPRYAVRASSGAAVLLVDHVTKSKEGRGRYAIGSQMKLAAIDGAQFNAEVVTPFARGKDGRVRLSVGKDRPGFVRSHATGDAHVQTVADMKLYSLDGRVKVMLFPPQHRELDDDGKTLPERLEQKIIDFLANGKSDKTAADIRSVVGGSNTARDRALNILVDSGRVVKNSGVRPAVYVLRP